MSSALIVGGGIFGITTALELHQRGHRVTVVEPGPIPHPLAASTDISKVVRMEYGTDDQYMSMVEAAIPGFRNWNLLLADELYHHTGVTMFTRRPMEPGGYEYESFQTLLRHGQRPERLQERHIRERFPQWGNAYVDGFYNPAGGYVESGRLLAGLATRARSTGVYFMNDSAAGIEEHKVVLSGGAHLTADFVIVATGTWTPLLVPEIAPCMISTGHPVFHLGLADTQAFSEPDFCTFTADIARSGWYGFPYNPRERVLKVANHGVGKRLHPAKDAREVYPADHEALRRFLRETFPVLVDAPVVYTRRCVYSDTLDEHFWIDRHPEKPWLTVAAGGSGHGMKFAPVLGPLIADAVEGIDNPWLPRFRWRDLNPETHGQEPARYHG